MPPEAFSKISQSTLKVYLRIQTIAETPGWTICWQGIEGKIIISYNEEPVLLRALRGRGVPGNHDRCSKEPGE